MVFQFSLLTHSFSEFSFRWEQQPYNVWILCWGMCCVFLCAVSVSQPITNKCVFHSFNEIRIRKSTLNYPKWKKAVVASSHTWTEKMKHLLLWTNNDSSHCHRLTLSALVVFNICLHRATIKHWPFCYIDKALYVFGMFSTVKSQLRYLFTLHLPM